MIFIDQIREGNPLNKTWLSAYKVIDLALLAMSGLHALWFFKNTSSGGQVAYLMLPLFFLSLLDYLSLAFHQRLLLNVFTLPVTLLVTISAMIWFVEPLVPAWLMISVFVILTRVPKRTAQALCLVFLGTAFSILFWKWDFEVIVVSRTIVPALLTLILIRIFVSINAQSLQQLDQTSELLKNALRTMTQGICVIDPSGRFKLFNEQACDLLDLPRALLETNPLLSEVVQFQAMRGDFGPQFMGVEAAAREYVASLGVNVDESIPRRYIRQDKLGRYIEVQSHPMPSGDIVRTYSDVTEYQTINNELQRLLAEEKRNVENLRQITADLNKANLRFNTTANSLPGALYEFLQYDDGSAGFMYFSDKMCEIFEIDRDSLLSNPSLFMSCVHPDDRIKLTNANRRAYEQGTDFYVELRIITPSGNTKWLQLNSAPQNVLDPTHSVWSGYAIDVTERVNLQAQATELKHVSEQNQVIKNLLRDKEELIESLLVANRTAETGALSAALAHELNQPLCAISIHAEVLQHKLKENDDPEIRDMLTYIAEDNKRASGIINALRRIFRQEVADSRKIDLNDLIKSLQPLYLPQVSVKRIAMRYALCDDGTVEVEPNEFQQVIINLMNNAISAFDGREEQDHKEILVQTRRNDKSLSFIVSDNGSGIPAETEPKLFSLLKTSSKNGMGLGLWLSKHIVEQHRGTIRFEHIATGGTRFIVELPL